jgi:two-component system sensor histidine kinase KdpD
MISMDRSRPDDFLEIIHRAKRGRLKIYIGPAAGVGKTFQMLEEAHQLRKRGVDVVLGFVETHGRAETEALLSGLESVPRKQLEYRGISIDEMDLDAVLARKPQVAVVDELAHTNVPGSRNGKRYQDARTLLEAGINVICAVNIQHLESLNDVVEKATGVAVRETVPDSFLKEADQVVNIDLSVEDLIERLKAGKIYAPEKVTEALRRFFTNENLSSLRELALRETAESLESARSKGDKAGAEASPVSRRVMVALSANPERALALLRRGSRMAGRLNTDWYAVYVETPGEAPERIDAGVQRRLMENLDKARELGAKVVHLKEAEPAAALLDFARANGVGHLVLGRVPLSWWKRVFRRSVLLNLLEEAEDLDLHVVALGEDEE